MGRPGDRWLPSDRGGRACIPKPPTENRFQAMSQSNCRPCRNSRPDAVRAYLPGNLGLDQVPAKWVDYAAWVVGRVYLEQHLKKGSHNRDDFTRLWSVALKQVLPKRDYRRIMEGLIDARILEEDPSYRAGDGSR